MVQPNTAIALIAESGTSPCRMAFVSVETKSGVLEGRLNSGACPGISSNGNGAAPPDPDFS